MERIGQYLPALVGGDPIRLPDYVEVEIENGTIAEVHPNRVSRFKKEQDEIKKKSEELRRPIYADNL